VNAACVLLFNPHLQSFDYATGVGFRTNAITSTRLRLGEGPAGKAVLERRLISIPDLASSDEPVRRGINLEGEDFVAYFASPLLAKGGMKGVLEIFHRSPVKPDPEWLDFMEAISAQAAIAIDNARMFDDLQRSNMELIMAYDSTLEGWVHALDLRDKETEGHTQRVTGVTIQLAREMGISESELTNIRRGALLHDIGKVGISDSILRKSSDLTVTERIEIERHPEYAYELLYPIAYLRPALEIPFCHHEKWDGTGYPRKLKGDQIPLAARIFAVVDVWDALRSKRAYREAWEEQQVLAYICDQSGQHFDPAVVDAFINMLRKNQHTNPYK
jgi:HD-GYP domain-containing protein (c-di-GMP phosphodiesterase class II)